jgi:uncharacterized membrane protein
MRETFLFFHFLGLAFAVGSGFASLFIGVYNKDLPPDERPKFMLKLRSLGYMGMTGLVILIISGGALATPYWSVIGNMPFFIAKLSLVVVMIVIAVLMDRRWRSAVKAGGGSDLQAIPKLGRLAFPVGILIVLFAVLQFR